MIVLVVTRRCKRGPTSPDQPVVASVAVVRESTAGIRNQNMPYHKAFQTIITFKASIEGPTSVFLEKV